MQLLTNPLLKSCFKIAGLSLRIPRRSRFVFHILFSHLQRRRSNSERIYLDIDECASGTQGYSENAVCNNNKGSYNCSCKPGYSGDGRTCQGKRDQSPNFI